MNDQNEHGSFLTGFTIGMFAGAASLFLFGTKKGNKVRNKLSKEWEDAKHYLEEEGVIEQGKTSVRDVFKSIVDNIHQHQAAAKKTNSRGKVRTTSKTSSKTTSKKPSAKKFKGT